ncbi:MAG: SDR family NAD(P)-dependent oxidoreductase [Gammaproteobacteria bacterium]
MDIKGKVVIVTGSSRSIGAALAVELGRLGARVVCSARSSSARPGKAKGTVDETVAQIRAAGGDALAVAADMGVEADVLRMVEATVAHYGRVDALVNNAALTGNKTSLFGDMAAFDQEMAVNLRGPLVAMREVARQVKKQGSEGRILNVTSSVGLNYLETLMAYGVSKLALERLTIDVAEQLKADRIACNAFRIDMPVWNVGYEDPDSFGGVVADYAEPSVVAAEGMIWQLTRPVEYTGQLESMQLLRKREGIMPSRSRKPFSVDVLPHRGRLRLEW